MADVYDRREQAYVDYCLSHDRRAGVRQGEPAVTSAANHGEELLPPIAAGVSAAPAPGEVEHA
jgi:hypothetical protein